MIADDRGSQIAESSAIVCDHMETHFCDPAIVIADDPRRSQGQSCGVVIVERESHAGRNFVSFSIITFFFFLHKQKEEK